MFEIAVEMHPELATMPVEYRGMFAISELEECIADTAYCAVEEMFTALTKPPEPKAND